MRPDHCNVHFGPTPEPFHKYDTFENGRFERLLKPVIVYLQCMLRDSHCYFSAMRLKSGGTVRRAPKSGGTRTPVLPFPPKVTPMSVAYKLENFQRRVINKDVGNESG